MGGAAEAALTKVCGVDARGTTADDHLILYRQVVCIMLLQFSLLEPTHTPTPGPGRGALPLAVPTRGDRTMRRLPWYKYMYNDPACYPQTQIVIDHLWDCTCGGVCAVLAGLSACLSAAGVWGERTARTRLVPRYAISAQTLLSMGTQIQMCLSSRRSDPEPMLPCAGPCVPPPER